MAELKNQGTCFSCSQVIEHRLVTKHVKKCFEQNPIENSSEKESIFLIKIFSGKEFWLYVEINGSVTLETLDDLLRATWLECCGHLSEFTINKARYSSDGGMKKAIHKTLSVGREFHYEYDFGSTTELEGEVIAEKPGKLENKIRLLARNDLPAIIQCALCGSVPEVICTDCTDFLCKKCKGKHKNCGDEEYRLPVVNSPRMGICGYTGPDSE